MSGQLRSLKNRIKSVSNTKKITRAMEMIAASKLKRYQDMLLQNNPYSLSLENLLKRVSRTIQKTHHPLMEKREEKKTALLIISSDTGLCGSYNAAILEHAKEQLEKSKSSPLLVGVGKWGVHAISRLGHKWDETFLDIKTNEIEGIIIELKNILSSLFLDKKADAVHVIYSHFISSVSYEVTTEKILPFVFEDDGESISSDTYIMEPTPHFLFEKLVPAVLESKMTRIFLESFVSEQIARMHAMHQATENAKEMIDSLVLLRNKARQTSITNELIEIVSGSRVLKS